MRSLLSCDWTADTNTGELRFAGVDSCGLGFRRTCFADFGARFPLKPSTLNLTLSMLPGIRFVARTRPLGSGGAGGIDGQSRFRLTMPAPTERCLRMTPKRRAGLIVNLGSLLGSLLMLSGPCLAQEPSESGVPMRIGWQFPNVLQGALIQVMKRTDVLERYGIEPHFIPYSYGVPQMQDARKGKLDVFFAGDQPIIQLVADRANWRIVAHAYTDRVALVVPANSPIQGVVDLKGKIVASPFGSIAHREAVFSQLAAGLKVDEEVINLNEDILEISDDILSSGDDWEKFDAAAVWEPHASALVHSGLARSLESVRTLGLLAMSDEFIEANPAAAVGFLVAVARALHFAAHNIDRVLRWYVDDTHIGSSLTSLREALRSDPNYAAASPHAVESELSEEIVKVLEANAAWGINAWEDGREIRRSIDQSLMAEADQIITGTARFDDLQVVLPSIGEVELDDGPSIVGMADLALVFISMVAVALLALEIGLQFGKRHHAKTAGGGMHTSMDTVATGLIAMVAFVIALTVGSASSRFDARKAALMDDVSSTHTAYLRARLLSEPQRSLVRNLLREYIQVRIGIAYMYDSPDSLRLVQRRLETLQKALWLHVEEISASDGGSQAHELLASALNDVFELHIKRFGLGAYYSLPDFIWWVLVTASSIAMIAVGFRFGASYGRRVLVANLSLALTFALIMLLAFDLDRAGGGFVTVDEQPMIDLYRGLHTLD